MTATEAARRTRKAKPTKTPAALLAALVTLLGACAGKPLLPYDEDTPPLVLVPAALAGVDDRRGRFREIFCAVLEQRKATVPDYIHCSDALVRVGAEPGATGGEVELGQSGRRLLAVIVPGVGWDCVEKWLDLSGSVGEHVRRFGYDQLLLPVDALSSSANNARQIRDAISAMEHDRGKPDLVLVGFSKGAPDILQAIVAYPEIRARVAAVVSAAGAVGGSPLANDATQSQLNLLQHWPDADCTPGDGGALESLRPATRKRWLAQNRLPTDLPYYSLVNYPRPERISNLLQSSYDKLARVDARNDGQVIFYDQVVPGSTLLGYVNADHWAMGVPVKRAHETIGALFVDQNNYPREALLEAVLRFIEEDLAGRGL
jgi:dienelactone hydrolase